MVIVLVTVGVFSTFEEIQRNAVKLTLPQIPSVGDIIVPDGELGTLIARKQKAWNLTCPINFVRHIGYYGSEIVVMLGGNPRLHTVDFHYKGNTVGGYISSIPSSGDMVHVPSFDERNYLYVTGVAYTSDGPIVDIFLSNKESVPSVKVENQVDVYVTNDINTNINDSTLDVRVVDQYGVLDVRTRREEYD